MTVRKIDWLIGPVLVVGGFLAVAGVVAAMNELGAETPTANVAELLEDAADEGLDDSSEGRTGSSVMRTNRASRSGSSSSPCSPPPPSR